MVKFGFVKGRIQHIKNSNWVEFRGVFIHIRRETQ
jgi:hypothetical protein